MEKPTRRWRSGSDSRPFDNRPLSNPPKITSGVRHTTLEKLTIELVDIIDHTPGIINGASSLDFRLLTDPKLMRSILPTNEEMHISSETTK